MRQNRSPAVNDRNSGAMQIRRSTAAKYPGFVANLAFFAGCNGTGYTTFASRAPAGIPSFPTDPTMRSASPAAGAAPEADSQALRGYFVKKIGANRGRPRIWLEGLVNERGGFTPGTRFDVTVQDNAVVLQVNGDGTRVVTGKKKAVANGAERDNPVIDINSRELLQIFDGMNAVRVIVTDNAIHLLPLASELRKRERLERIQGKLARGEEIVVGSLAHGGGVLASAVHDGLQQAGVPTRLGFAGEIRDELIEHASEHNPAWDRRTIPLSAPMQELAMDEDALARVPRMDIVEAGIPCSGASQAGRAKGQLAMAEAHPEVGHLVVSALAILNRTQAAVILIENVPAYRNTASACILRWQLRDMGYVTHEAILDGADWNTLEHRKRWCMVAVTHGLEFDFEAVLKPQRVVRRLGEALDDIPADSPRWTRMQHLKDKMARNAAEGNRFLMQVFTADDEKIGTLTKGYAKVRSTDPKIAHPTDPEQMRQLYAREHARIKGVPEGLVAGLSEKVAHEILGQSIVYAPFMAVAEELGRTIQRAHKAKRAVAMPAATEAPPAAPKRARTSTVG